MHGFAKRGLALAAATSGLVLATAGIAAADTAASGSTARSGGLVSGNAANVAASIPVNACGNQALLIALKDDDAPQMCTIGDGAGAVAKGRSYHSGGALSGNVVDVAASVPINACGNQVGVVAVRDYTGRSHCRIDGGGARATGSSYHSGGLLSGNVVNAAVSVPVNACGNQVDLVGVANRVAGSKCSID